MIAAQHGHCEMIQWLLENGADINAVNKVTIGSHVVGVQADCVYSNRACCSDTVKTYECRLQRPRSASLVSIFVTQ